METPVAAAPTQPVRVKVPVIPMQYHGKNGEVLKLHIVNLLMNIITLGIYSFWGKTRIRKYMTSHITLGKDRFEYTGTGKELMVGWIKAMVIFLPLIICIQIPVVNFIALPMFFAVLSVAIFLALRYRLSRTRWRGIRFSLGGSVKAYLILSLKRTLINVVTLGWKIPKGDILKWSYIANHMSYGDMKFSFAGDEKRLQKVHLITLVILLFAGLVPVVAGGAMKGKELIDQARARHEMQVQPMSSNAMPQEVAAQNSDGESGLAAIVGLAYVGFGAGFLSRLWYQAALWQEKFRGLRIGTLRFKIDVTGGGLAKLYFTNILLIVFTFGIAKPIAANRTLRYFISNLRVGGDINELIAEQSKAAQGTGMGDALAADVGFDLGL